MFSRLVCSLLLAVGLLLQPLAVAASGITTYPALVSPAYWLKQNQEGDKLVLDDKGIDSFNTKIRSVSRTV